MDAEFILAIFGGGFDIFIGKYSGKANSDHPFFAINIYNAGLVYFDSECGYGRVDDFVDSRCYDELLGCNWQLYLNFNHKLPCQHRDA